MRAEMHPPRMSLRMLWYHQAQVTGRLNMHVDFVAQGNAGIGAFGPDVFANHVECGHC